MRTNNVHFVQHVTMAPRRILLVQCSQTMNYVSNVDVLQVVKWRAEKCLVVIHYYNDIAFPPNVYIHNSYSWLVQYFGANAIQPCFQILSWRKIVKYRQHQTCCIFALCCRRIAVNVVEICVGKCHCYCRYLQLHRDLSIATEYTPETVKPISSLCYTECHYYGNTYALTEEFEAVDGCNTCFCDYGIVTCSEVSCGKMSA